MLTIVITGKCLRDRSGALFCPCGDLQQYFPKVTLYFPFFLIPWTHICHKAKDTLKLSFRIGVYLGPYQISKMELFATIVNG